MKIKSLREIETHVRNSVGISTVVSSESETGHHKIVVHSADPGMEHPHGWELEVERFDLHVRFDFRFDDYAADLKSLYIDRLILVSEELSQLGESLETSGFEITFYSSGNSVNPKNLLHSNENTHFHIKGKFRPTDNEEESLTDTDFLRSMCSFISMCISPLLPDEHVTNYAEEDGLPEGALTKVLVNKYERSPRNRSACISHYGAKCAVCDFDFGKAYGEFASNYIHVHHIVPVSKIGPDYVINPVKDLIPLCPNCHAAIHLKNPPLLPDQLKSLISKSDSTN